jgi:hypothetical protein
MEPHMRHSPRKEYYQGSQCNSAPRSPAWTPRSRSGYKGGDGNYGPSRDSMLGSYYGQDEHGPASGHDRFEDDTGLQKTLSNLSLGKTYSGPVDSRDVGGRLQRTQSRGLDQTTYPQRGPSNQNGRGSGEFAAAFPGRSSGRGDPMGPVFGPGRGRPPGPVRVCADGRRGCDNSKLHIAGCSSGLTGDLAWVSSHH